MLAFSQHHVFRHTDKGDWVRTGVDGDGNCFYHAYAYSMDASTVSQLSKQQRLDHVLTIKHEFANRITFNDTSDLIDMSSFDSLVQLIDIYLAKKQLKFPDLSKEPLYSIGEYVALLCQLHPVLQSDTEFHRHVVSILKQYHASIQEYVRRNGTWVFDALIDLFMKKMDINIWIISDTTKERITHYPLGQARYTMFMYHINDHYESVGLHKDKKMTRVFEHPFFP
jgi:hypothetical protein